MSYAPISFKVAATLAAQRIVSAVTGSAMTCQLHLTLTALPLGVTVDTVLDTINSIPVQVAGVANVYFNDTMTSGELCTGDTSGRGIPFTLADTSTSISAPAAYLGVYLGASFGDAGDTGTVGPVLICPGFDRATR